MQSILTADASGEELVRSAEQLAEALVRANLTRGQVRIIFGEMRQIEALWGQDPGEGLRRLTMLKPKLAYQTARTPAMEGLAKALSEGIDGVLKAPAEKRDEAFRRLVEFFEAVLAYHRAKGGRN